MGKKGIGKAKPGTNVTRRITRGPGKGDLAQLHANSAGSKNPGKLVPRRIIKDVPPKNTQTSLPTGKKKK